VEKETVGWRQNSGKPPHDNAPLLPQTPCGIERGHEARQTALA